MNNLPQLGPGELEPAVDLVTVYHQKTGQEMKLQLSALAGNPPSGVSGAIQFSGSSAFASDAANLFWDDTNNRLGIGTNAPTQALEVVGQSRFSDNILFTTDFKNIGRDLNNSSISFASINSQIRAKISTGGTFEVHNNGIGQTRFQVSAGGQTTISGGGSTSATTSLLVQNSAGTMALSVKDNLETEFGGATTFNTLMAMRSGSFLFEASNAGYLMNANGLRFGNSIGLLFGSAGANSGSPDTGLNRSASGTVKVTNGSTGYGSIDTSLYKVSGTNGFTGTGSYTNFTIVGGIITNAS